MTVSGLTITSAVRHPVQVRESMTQSQRSTFASRTRRGRVRCSTCSWCRNVLRTGAQLANAPMYGGSGGARGAPTSSLKSVSIAGRNINCRNKNGLFSRDSRNYFRHCGYAATT
jgi:hypothetical protein